MASSVLSVRVDRRVHELYKSLPDKDRETVRRLVEAVVLLIGGGFSVIQAPQLSRDEHSELCTQIAPSITELYKLLSQYARVLPGSGNVLLKLQRLSYLLSKLCA